MKHPDEETLVGLVLGDVTDPETHSHVGDCASCKAEMTRTADVIAATKQLGGQTIKLQQPPDSVWDHIAQETQIAGQPKKDAPADAPVHPNRRKRVVVGAIAGFAVGVAATVAGVVIVDRGTQEVPPSLVTIAQGPLKPLGDSKTHGSAKMVKKDGYRSVQIKLARPPTTDGAFVQAWLLDPETNGMIPLGVMDRWDETFPIPKGVDVRAYDSIDPKSSVCSAR